MRLTEVAQCFIDYLVNTGRPIASSLTIEATNKYSLLAAEIDHSHFVQPVVHQRPLAFAATRYAYLRFVQIPPPARCDSRDVWSLLNYWAGKTLIDLPNIPS